MLPWWEQVNPLIIPGANPRPRIHRRGTRGLIAEDDAVVYAEMEARADRLLLNPTGAGGSNGGGGGLQPDPSTCARKRCASLTFFRRPERPRPNSDRRVLAKRPFSSLHERRMSSIMRWRDGKQTSA